MAKRPIEFKPQLFEPQGFNNYPGTIFRCFTAGDTLPFEFNFENSDGSVLDVTGWTVEISFSTELDSASGLSVNIPLIDVDTSLFYGEITDEETATLTPGINYGIASYTDAVGNTFIIDMCILEVYQNLDFTL